MAYYATVALDIGVDKKFTYRVPSNLEHAVKPGVRVYVPFRSRRLMAYVVAVSSGADDRRMKPLLSVRDRKPVVSESLIALAEWMASYYCCSLSSVFRCMIPSSVRRGHAARMPLFVKAEANALADPDLLETLGRRAPKQAAVLRVLRNRDAPMKMKSLTRAARTGSQTVRAMEKKGLVVVSRLREYRDPWGRETVILTEHLSPTDEQARALGYITRMIREKISSVVLLHGVTGSGKTEVYLQAINEALRKGRGAIMLVPEIALTPQMVDGFKSRFPEKVAVFHSRLSAGERLDEWEKLREGKARVVVGARSALFAPVSSLGVIIVDEEHERTYKQEETPRYHARDVAVRRAAEENATVILGSATPSLDSYRNALNGNYRLFHLPRRIDNRSLPRVTIIDIKEEMKRVGRMTLFSRRLLRSMEEKLERGEQVILFLNRRGFSPVVMCVSCGHVQKCGNCSISLTWHKEKARMLCHLCGYEQPPFSRCPRCRSKTLRFPGFGTQKLEEMTVKLFPHYRVARMDTDSMKGKDSHAAVLNDFKTGKIQILLGTQMIAKGLHFPNVTLVGVVLADTALNLPDFRASETTFQILTQVAGRAGRGEVPGEVIIQTFSPKHPAIVAAGTQDYKVFYAQESRFREELSYPPFSHFILLTVRGRGEQAVEWFSRQLIKMLQGKVDDEMELMGPVPAPLKRVKGYYRWQLIARGRDVFTMNAILRSVLDDLTLPASLQIVVDVDPQSML